MISKSSNGGVRDRPQNKSSLKTARRSQPVSLQQRNHQARHESGSQQTRRQRQVRQDHHTDKSRCIINANAKESVLRNNYKANPPPFASFQGGVRAAARQTRRTSRAKQHEPLAQTSLGKIKNPSPLSTKISRVPSRTYLRPPSNPTIRMW